MEEMKAGVVPAQVEPPPHPAEQELPRDLVSELVGKQKSQEGMVFSLPNSVSLFKWPKCKIQTMAKEDIS